MAYEAITLEKESGIATLTLNRPVVLNALNPVLLADIAQAIDEVEEDDEQKVLILTGAGRGFCSGADLSSPIPGSPEAAANAAARQGRRLKTLPFAGFGRVALRLRAMSKPTIAAVNGVATGAGFSLALGCDIRIASEAARFSAIFVRRALVADTGATYLLPRIIGTARAMELMFTGDFVDAHEAERIGLVSRVVPPDQLMPAAKELAMKIAKGPSVSIELMKRMVYDGLEANNFAASLAYEGWAQSVCHLTEDTKEGRLAFQEKREPNFKGQ